MLNIAWKKKVEETIANPTAITDGDTVNYSATDGFGEFLWPGTVTVDLEDIYDLLCVRILLWDGLGGKNRQRDVRIYKYRLLTSRDHQTWKVVFDSSNDGGNGWQVFDLQEPLSARYVRVHGLFNSANAMFHVVQIEAFDQIPAPLEDEIVLHRTMSTGILIEEKGDGLPLETRVNTIINNIEAVVGGYEVLNPKPFRELISKLKVQVRDVAALERGMESIRREIIKPVQAELERSTALGRFSVWGFWVGLVGGLLAILSILIGLVPWLQRPQSENKAQSENKPQQLSLQRSAIPNRFYFDYDHPPGRHDWSRMGDEVWMERLPNGSTNEFRVSGRIVSGECLGSLLYRIDLQELEVVIPDRSCPSQAVLQRHKKSPWSVLGYMKNVE